MLAYIDELALAGGRVQDATFNRLREHFVDEAILELTYTGRVPGRGVGVVGASVSCG